MENKFEAKKYLYYGLVGIISLITLIFIPMIGSEGDIGFNLPSTVGGWAIYVTTKLLVSILNILIFHCFMQQAKLNISDNENYKKANEILNKIKHKTFIPRAPEKWNKEQYGVKGLSIFIGTAFSTIALTNAILTYDYISLITYLLVIITGVIFGILQMKYAEVYWTTEYYQYALYYKDNLNKINRKEITKCLTLMAKNLETLKNKS